MTTAYSRMTPHQHAAYLARDTARQAVARGKLPRLDGTVKCTDCPAPATEYDHRDYAKSKRLDVVPVCHACNVKRGPGRFGPPRSTLVRVILSARGACYQAGALVRVVAFG
jgi:hypothetical protein